MKEITAKLNDYRVSPRKVRLVADLMRGKKVSEAMMQLNMAAKKSAPILIKLLKSAMSNAKANFNLSEDEIKNLIVKKITVDGGRVLKRHMPRARGSAAQILKRTSHVAVTLGIKEGQEQKAQEASIKPQIKPKKAIKKAK